MDNFLQMVQMIIISVGGQFSAKSTDVAISCQKIQMLSISVSDDSGITLNAEEQVALIVGQYRDRLCLLINSTDV